MGEVGFLTMSSLKTRAVVSEYICSALLRAWHVAEQVNDF